MSEENMIRDVMSRIGELGERVTALEAARVRPAEARESDEDDGARCENCTHSLIWHLSLGCTYPGCDCPVSIRPAAPLAPVVNPCPICRKPLADDVHALCIEEAHRAWIGDDAPDPAPTVALDPVLVAICDIYRKTLPFDGDPEIYDVMVEEFRERAGLAQWGDLGGHMLAYGGRA